LGEQQRHHIPKSLRQNDSLHRLGVSQPERVRGVDLASRYALNAGPNDFSVVRRLEEREPNEGGSKSRIGRPTKAKHCAQELGHNQEEPQEDHDERKRSE
jgi:hypothetical protein